MRTTIFILSLVFSTSALASGTYEIPVSKKDTRFDGQAVIDHMEYRYKKVKCNGEVYALAYSAYWGWSQGSTYEGICKIKNAVSLKSCMDDNDLETIACHEKAMEAYKIKKKRKAKEDEIIDLDSVGKVDPDFYKLALEEESELEKVRATLDENGVFGGEANSTKCKESTSDRIHSTERITCAVSIGSQRSGNKAAGSLVIPTERFRWQLNDSRGSRDLGSGGK